MKFVHIFTYSTYLTKFTYYHVYVHGLPYNSALFGHSEDNETTRIWKHGLLALLRRHIPPTGPATTPSHSQANPSHAELDMREVMDAEGGPNYETVLLKTDMHMRPDSERYDPQRVMWWQSNASQCKVKDKVYSAVYSRNICILY